MNKKLRAIAVFQIVSGAVGFLLVVASAPSFLQVPGGAVAMAAILCLCALSVTAGSLLLRGKWSGVLLSRIVQAAQVPVIIVSPVIYYCGLGVFLGLGGSSGLTTAGSLQLAPEIQVQLGVHFMAALAEGISEPAVAVNAVAVTLLILLSGKSTLAGLKQQQPNNSSKPTPLRGAA